MRKWLGGCSISGVLALGVGACESRPPRTNNPPPNEITQVAVLKSKIGHGEWAGMAVAKKYLYLASQGIHVFEVRAGSDATEVAVFDSQTASTLVVRGDRLYYADEKGLNVADISSPPTIKPLGLVKDFEFGAHALRAIKASPTQVVVPSTGVITPNEVILFDLIHPEQPEQVARFLVGGDVASLAIDGATLYVSGAGFVEVWDVSNWDAPVRRANAQEGCGLLFSAGSGVALCGQGGRDGVVGRAIVDARDPSLPILPMTEASPWFAVSLFERVGSYVYAKVYLKGHPNGIVYPFDIRDPLHPRPTTFGSHSLTELGGAEDQTLAIAADDDFVYTLFEQGAAIYLRQSGSNE